MNIQSAWHGFTQFMSMVLHYNKSLIQNFVITTAFVLVLPWQSWLRQMAGLTTP